MGEEQARRTALGRLAATLIHLPGKLAGASMPAPGSRGTEYSALRATPFLLANPYFPRLAAYCLLPTAYCRLPTADCQNDVAHLGAAG